GELSAARRWETAVTDWSHQSPRAFLSRSCRSAPRWGTAFRSQNDDVSFHSDQTRNAGIGRVVIQGISVLATRKPVLSFRKSTVFLMRLAARSCSGGLFQEPPRLIRRAQSSPAVHAVPSSGAPS